MTRKLSRDTVLRSLPPETIGLVGRLVEQAERLGLGLLLVGGPVRDLLLGRTILDVDLLVEPHDGAGAMELARAAAPRDARVVEYERFGTVSLETPDARVDLATVRRESYRKPGALPQVEAGTLAEDLHRRDFSINALALPLTGASGDDKLDVVDLEDGLSDLDRGTLRVLHERSFHDDPTRALRAARLAGRLGMRLSRGSRSLLRDAVRDGVFGAVSGDRLRREIDRIFADAACGLDPAEALRRLDDWHVLGALEPGLTLPRESLAPLRRLGRGLADPPWRGPRLRPGAAGLATWLAPLPAALRRRTLGRLSLRGELAERLASFGKDRASLLTRLGGSRGRGVVDGLLHGLDEERLVALHAWAPAPVRRRIVRWAAEDRTRRSPVNGSELVELGLSGPAVGRALARIRAGFLDGEIANREEALALARELARRAGRRSEAAAPARRSRGR